MERTEQEHQRSSRSVNFLPKSLGKTNRSQLFFQFSNENCCTWLFYELNVCFAWLCFTFLSFLLFSVILRNKTFSRRSEGKKSKGNTIFSIKMGFLKINKINMEVNKEGKQITVCFPTCFSLLLVLCCWSFSCCFALQDTVVAKRESLWSSCVCWFRLLHYSMLFCIGLGQS